MNDNHQVFSLKIQIVNALSKGKILCDVCSDYSLEPSTSLHKENWSSYKLEQEGWIREKKTGEVHYKIN